MGHHKRSRHNFTCAGGRRSAYFLRGKPKTNPTSKRKTYKVSSSSTTLLMPVLEKLHDHACERDRAGNRKLHYDQYAALILLYFFNPIVTSLPGIVQAGELHKGQRMLKCSRAALGP
ncbi:MAG: hypothetical protein IIB60_05225 [Planctomycetes bacterium]|nr:hypothetical protein [Planctomycetota bacterium]